MAFVLNPKAKLKTKVEVVERGDFGKTEKSEFVVEFNKLSVSQLDPIRQKAKGENAFSEEVFAQIKAHITGWEGVFDQDKNEISFNAENLDAMLDWTEARRAIYFAFWDVQNGAVEKN